MSSKLCLIPAGLEILNAHIHVTPDWGGGGVQMKGTVTHDVSPATIDKARLGHLYPDLDGPD